MLDSGLGAEVPSYNKDTEARPICHFLIALCHCYRNLTREQEIQITDKYELK